MTDSDHDIVLEELPPSPAIVVETSEDIQPATLKEVAADAPLKQGTVRKALRQLKAVTSSLGVRTPAMPGVPLRVAINMHPKRDFT